MEQLIRAYSADIRTGSQAALTCFLSSDLDVSTEAFTAQLKPPNFLSDLSVCS